MKVDSAAFEIPERLRRNLTVPGRNSRAQPPLASVGQRGMWLQDQLDPTSRVNNEAVLLTLRGPLDPVLVQPCVTELVGRHESLRTTLRLTEDGDLRQIIHDHRTVVIPCHDLRHLDPEDRMSTHLRLVANLTGARFDLAEGPLLRIELSHIDEDVHVLILAFHHAILDGWSLDLLFDEFAALYTAHEAGAAAELSPAAQYADFVAWQHHQLDCGAFDADVNYWRRHLSGAPPVLNLPTDHPRTRSSAGPAAVVRATLPCDATEHMANLTHRDRITPFMAVLAAYQMVLARWANTHDVVVGTPAANRTGPDIERSVGYFLTMLPLRTDISGVTTFRQLFRRVRDTVVAALDHQSVPFPDLVDHLSGAREPGVSPVFQAVIISQEVQRRSFTFTGITAEYDQFDPIDTSWDLTLHLVPGRTEHDGSTLGLEYRADRFTRPSMEQRLDQLSALITMAVAEPDRNIPDPYRISVRSRANSTS